MAYKPTDTFFPPLVEGNVRTSGGGLSLGVGELAFVNLNKTTKDGAQVLSDFTPLSPDTKLAIRMGEPNDYVSRSESNKPISTIPFTLKDVTNIYVSAPEKEGVDVDDWIIGFNGTDGTEIDLDNAENEFIDLTLSNGPIGMVGLPDNKITFKVGVAAPTEGAKATTTVPNAGEWTMEQIVTEAYDELRNRMLPGNIPITDYVDIMLVNSENPTTIPGTAQTFYNLVLQDDGTQANLGEVQAQYPELDVKRLEWKNERTTYSVLGTSLPAAYQPPSDFVLKGCDTCPAGYTELSQGAVYEVVIEDPADNTAAVQALPGAEAGTAILNDQDGDTTFYSVVTDNELTQAEIDAFIAANSTASINLISKDVTDLCASAAPATVAWVAGESCNMTTETYQLRIADDKCGNSRLAEVQAAYPNLTVTEVAASDTACQRTYETTVNTNLVCEECAPIFRTTFESEAPDTFDGIAWTKPEKVYSGTAKMGIRVRGKRSTLSGNEYLRDNMPFFDDSVEICLAGGYSNYVNESYLAGTNDRFTVKLLSRKSAAHNLGGNLRKYEEEAQMEFRGRKRYVGNNYAKTVLGQETRLKGLQNYLVYAVTIAPLHYASDFQQSQNGAFTYHFPVEIGKQAGIEDVLNKLAAATGNKQIQGLSNG